MSHDVADLQAIEDEFNEFINRRNKEAKREAERAKRIAKVARRDTEGFEQEAQASKQDIKVSKREARAAKQRAKEVRQEANLPSRRDLRFVEEKSHKHSFMAEFLVPFFSGLGGVFVGSLLVLLFLYT